MATIVLPQALIFQDFVPNVDVPASILYAAIVGPHADLIRYAVADEKPRGRLGSYDHLAPTNYLWPDRPAGGLVDDSYVKLFMQDALLEYFNDPASADSLIKKVSGHNNRIRSDSVAFKTNGTFLRDAVLLDRDVQLGDVVRVRGVVSAVTYETCATVQGFVGEVVAASIAGAVTDADDAGSQSFSASLVKTDGPDNCIDMSVHAASYNGLADGDINEVYTIRVTQSSSGGNFTTARLRVTSASGNDDDLDVTPASASVSFDVGKRGLQLSVASHHANLCSQDAEDDGVASNDLVEGQVFTATVHQLFAKPVPTSGGTFTGSRDTTYIVSVSRGGKYTDDDLPQISVTTARGDDLSGPTDVTAASTFVAIGTKGVLIKFTGAGLCKGDKYYVDAVAQTEGALQTLVLSKNLPDQIDTTIDLSVELYIRKPLLEIAKNRVGFAPETNYDLSATELTVNDGIIAYDATWTDSGVPQPLPVRSQCNYGTLYAEVRYWLDALCSEVGTSTVDTLSSDISGPTHPDNPLKYGVFKALQNSNGAPVKFIAVCEPDDNDSWQLSLEKLAGREDIHGLVPLTRNVEVLGMFEAQVRALSEPEAGQWRVGWFNLNPHAEQAIVTATNSTDSDEVLAVVEDDPNTAGTQYTIVRVPGGNGDFMTNGARSGDICRMLFSGDGFGGETYSEFVIDAVTSEDELRLLTGPDAAVNEPAKIEIWRNLTATEESEAIAVESGNYGYRKIRAVWPDELGADGYTVAGYFLCAALAGFRSGVAPHQGLTNGEITGFDNVDKTSRKFTREQIKTMVAGGTWVVTQDLLNGGIYTVHAVTTGDYSDPAQREEMVDANVDEISQEFRDLYKPFIGRQNVTDSVLNILDVETRAKIEELKSSRFTEALGGQLLDSSVVTRVDRHATLADRVVIALDAVVPVPVNNIELHERVLLVV